jgi:hypothetical protein
LIDCNPTVVLQIKTAGTEHGCDDALAEQMVIFEKCDRHGHELAGESPAITLKGGNM